MCRRTGASALRGAPTLRRCCRRCCPGGTRPKSPEPTWYARVRCFRGRPRQGDPGRVPQRPSPPLCCPTSLTLPLLTPAPTRPTLTPALAPSPRPCPTVALAPVPQGPPAHPFVAPPHSPHPYSHPPLSRPSPRPCPAVALAPVTPSPSPLSRLSPPHPTRTASASVLPCYSDRVQEGDWEAGRRAGGSCCARGYR